MSWDEGPAWEAARARTRDEVRAAFAPRTRRCQTCGHEAATGARDCPACGRSYVVNRDPGLSRRAKRRLLLAMLVAATVLAGSIAAIAPNLRHASSAWKLRRHAEQVRALARVRHQLAIDQKLRAAPGPAHASPAALLASLETHIDRDALARVRARRMQGPILRTNCSPWAPSPRSGSILRFQCTAVNATVKRDGRAVGAIGYPFWAKIDASRRRLYWCKINPKAGEQAVTEGQPSVPLDRRCNLDM